MNLVACQSISKIANNSKMIIQAHSRQSGSILLLYCDIRFFPLKTMTVSRTARQACPVPMLPPIPFRSHATKHAHMRLDLSHAVEFRCKQARKYPEWSDPFAPSHFSITFETSKTWPLSFFRPPLLSSQQQDCRILYTHSYTRDDERENAFEASLLFWSRRRACKEILDVAE